MLTEKLSQLKLPLTDVMICSEKLFSSLKLLQDSSFKKLAAKTNNEFLLKMIQQSQKIDIDIEADALSALDDQYNKIGRCKKEEINNNNNNNAKIFSYGTPSVKGTLRAYCVTIL